MDSSMVLAQPDGKIFRCALDHALILKTVQEITMIFTEGDAS
jgi:hypothetical protein